MKNKWEKRFIEMADLVASWSKDPSTKVGAVIVDQNKRIISVGFNGYPKNIPDDDLDIRENKYAKVLHAEKNAILFAKRDLKDCEMFCTHIPCSQCASAIIQSDISTVITRKPSDDYMSRWSDSVKITEKMFSDASVHLIYIDDLKEVPEDSIEAKLYNIIDDIDTAFDMFKPEMKGFEKFTEKKICEARQHIYCPDGHILIYKNK